MVSVSPLAGKHVARLVKGLTIDSRCMALASLYPCNFPQYLPVRPPTLLAAKAPYEGSRQTFSHNASTCWHLVYLAVNLRERLQPKGVCAQASRLHLRRDLAVPEMWEFQQ